ncbi:MAG: cell wall-binding repeat-containing protein [Microcella pacifica]|uniref:cell wall-binding repeat-containing protein n=1 Tax=Microcella pacifica TaxID=2591847 RepID=UPI003315667E
MVEVDPDSFAQEGAALPIGLQRALARDVGITGAEWLAQSEAGNAAADVVAELSEVIDVVDARLEGYHLVVTVENAADARLAESVGARVEFGSAPVVRETAPVKGLEPAQDLRGGVPYIFDNAGRCSVGFVGLATGTDQLQILSAGHCERTAGDQRRVASIDKPTISGGSVSSPLTTIGNGGLHVLGQHPNPGYTEETFYDFGITPVTNGAWAGKPEIVTWGNSTSGAPLSSPPLVIRDAGPAIAGTTICKSGSTTGWTCGPVTFVDEVVYVGSGTPTCPSATAGDYCVGGILADICVRKGDSGGPAVVGSRAVGISSAASNAEAGTCAVSGNVGVFATLYSSDPALEQITKLYPDWEPLIGLTSTSRNSTSTVRLDPDTTSSILGRVTGGSTRHSVDVSINGGAPATYSVNSSGDWSVPLAGLRGTLAWSATASWGSQTQAAPTTGSIFVADGRRLAGADRYQTAIEISRYAFPCGSTVSVCAPGEVPVVYIANGLNFPDALSAGPAATLEGGPLLLTSGRSISAAVAAELDRLKPAQIVIVGSAAVVSAAVASALVPYTTSQSASDVIRLGGANRYETSRLIAARLLSLNFVRPGTELWLATGRNYPDALSAGAAAAGRGAPILLVDGNASTLDAATRAFISEADKLDVSRAYIAGSAAVMSSGIEATLASLLGGSSNVQRAGGADRFATSLLINKIAFPNSGPGAPEVYLSYAFNFPDALAGGVLAGSVGGPLYISRTGCVASGIVDHVLDASPSTVVVLGSTPIISDSVRDLRRC